MNGDLFWAVLLFISGCVIISLYRHIRKLQEIINTSAMDELLDRWDEEYREIVSHYGSGEAFEEAHTQDYNIFRSNVLIFVNRVKDLNSGLDRSLSYLEKEFNTNKDVKTLAIKLGAVKGAATSAINRLVDDTVDFLKNEEAAHLGKEYIDEVLESLSKEVKNNNFYDEKKD